jgi:predicted GNAT family N-acyltransferase
MAELEHLARTEGHDSVVLDAREHAAGFYERRGYERYGTNFISPRTGTPHVKMRRRLL